MEKITNSFIIDQYRSGIQNYTEFTTEVGLWESEQYVFQKYLKPTDQILDIGCGTGRTTFHLFRSGFENIRGLDLTPEMIEQARTLNDFYQTAILFEIGDATKLSFAAQQFDSAIFSFNGIMSIPESRQRMMALKEIYRVLKPGGYFIFTTHDREKDAAYFDLWKAEEERWKNGKQDPRLYEFGDLVTQSKNETRTIFIHIPNQTEVINCIEQAGFELVESFYRSDQFEESEAVREKSGECRFWVVRK